MATEETRKSIQHALQSLASWASVLGIVVSAVAICNFIFSLATLPITATLSALLDTYRLIVHGLINWLLWPFGWKLPPWLTDVLFLYGVLGGAFMRARMREQVYPTVPAKASLLRSLKIVCQRRVKLPDGSIPLGRRATIFYQESPQWVRRAMDAILWPRVARLYYSWPRVFRNDYLGTYPSFKVGYQPPKYKEFMYDRRHVFYMQLIAAIAATMFILVINGLLSIPRV